MYIASIRTSFAIDPFAVISDPEELARSARRRNVQNPERIISTKAFRTTEFIRI